MSFLLISFYDSYIECINLCVFEAQRGVSVYERESEDWQPDADNGQPTGPSDLSVELRGRLRRWTAAGRARRRPLRLPVHRRFVVAMRARPVLGARQTLEDWRLER